MSKKLTQRNIWDGSGKEWLLDDDCDNGRLVDRIKEIYPILYGKIDFPKSKLIVKEFARGIVVKMVKGKKFSWVGFGHETNINQRSKWLSWMENCIEKKAILLSKTIVEMKIEEGVKDLTKGERKVKQEFESIFSGGKVAEVNLCFDLVLKRTNWNGGVDEHSWVGVGIL
jgi:hypothetical protein